LASDQISPDVAQHDRRAAATGAAVAAWGLCLLIALVGAASRYNFGYACDELQNVQFARNISRGLVPYRDFFEHHPPLFHYLTAPLVAGAGATDAPLLLVFRVLAFLCLVLMAWALACLCRACRVGRWAPWAAAAVLLTSPASTALYELRADWWGLTCFLGAITLLLEASSTTKAAWRRAAWAGVLGGVALLFTQKAGMLLCGVGLWQAGVIAASRSGAQGRRRLAQALIFYAAVALPVVLMLLFFAWHGAE
jgi:hypothetical protein